MPVYPLLHINLVLLVVATSTNIVYLANTMLEFALICLILLASLVVSSVQRADKNLLDEHEVFDLMGMSEPIKFLKPDNLNSFYTIHLC